MKKGFKILLAIVFVFVVIRVVQYENIKKSMNTKEWEQLTQDTEYETNDYFFTLVSIDTTKTLSNTISADEGYDYIDIILDYTNRSREVFKTDDITGFFIDEKHNQYDDIECYVEKSRLDPDGTIESGKTYQIHIVFRVPDNITKGNAYLDMNNSSYFVTYDKDGK